MRDVSNWIKTFVVIILCGVAFAAGALWQVSAPARPHSSDPCASGALSPSYALLSSQLREFDDALVRAINVPRDLVVNQVEELQSIRRQTEQLAVPDCVRDLKANMVAYMNQIVDLVVAFLGGTPPEMIFQGLQGSAGLRQAMEAEMAQVIGATVTPYPTSMQLSLPVTGSTTEMAVTAEVSPAAVFAVVSNAQGANLREAPNAESQLLASLPPDTQVSILGVSADGLWFSVQLDDGTIGWLYVSLVTVAGSTDTVPVVE